MYEAFDLWAPLVVKFLFTLHFIMLKLKYSYYWFFLFTKTSNVYNVIMLCEGLDIKGLNVSEYLALLLQCNFWYDTVQWDCSLILYIRVPFTVQLWTIKSKSPKKSVWNYICLFSPQVWWSDENHEHRETHQDHPHHPKSDGRVTRLQCECLVWFALPGF